MTVPNRNRGSFPESRCLRRRRPLPPVAAAGAVGGEAVAEERLPALLPVRVLQRVQHRELRVVEAGVGHAVAARQRAPHQELLRAEPPLVARLEVAVAVEVAVLLRLLFPRLPSRWWIFFLLAESICRRGAV